MIKSIRKFINLHRINAWVIFYILVYIVLVIKLVTITRIDTGLFFRIYSVVVSAYILSRFVIAYFYDHNHPKYNVHYEPTVAFGVPSKNEGENIYETILRIANTDYPRDKFKIIAINDGSTDNTLDEMLRAKKDALEKNGIEVIVIDWEVNKGKREGMAEKLFLAVNQAGSNLKPLGFCESVF